MGQDEDEKLQMKQPKEKKEAIVANGSSGNFFSRLASIPIIQDSFMGAQNLVRQHAVGQKALDYAETKLQSIAVQAQPYYEQNNTILSRANTFGNRSLDLLEKQFPSISSPTQQLVQPITGRIESAVSHLKEKKTTVVDARIDSLAASLESLLDQYLPADEKEEAIEANGANRLLNVINVLSTRASKRISNKVSATNDEEKKIRQLIHAWVLEQVNTMAQQPQVESLKTKFFHDNSPIQVMYNFTQTEFDKVRQELNKPNIGHMDRIRNILVLSQTDILLPLYRSIWVRQPAKSEQVEAN